MKRIYSIILQFAFTVGIVQPILPMVEYHLHKGDLSKFFQGNAPVQESCEVLNCLCNCSANCDTQEQEQQYLLDVEFYPIPIKIFSSPDLTLNPEPSMLYIFIHNSLQAPHPRNSSPPPKLA